MERTLVDQVRRFNRTVTQRLGALDDRFLARARPLAEARMLWEIGPDGCEVRALRARLGLDSGHASRLLRALEADGMVTVAASEPDRRVRRVRLTRAGLAERAVLERRSEEFARDLLRPLDDGQRERLVAAMRDVERLLTAAMVELRPVDAADPDARLCIRSYYAELDRRSESGFDPAQGVSAEPHELRPPAGLFLVAYLRSEPVGCGGVKHHAGAPSEIKRMWVSANARGLGIGRRLLEALEADAARAGAPATRLETNRALTEAISLYRSAGYVEVAPFSDEPFAHHWFEKPLRQRRRGPGAAPRRQNADVVRYADPRRDAPACAAIYAPYVTDTVVTFEETAPSADEMSRRMERTAATHPWLVAERDGDVVGFAYASPHRERASYRWAVDVSVYIAATHHRLGIGRQLYTTLLRLLSEQRFHVAVAGITLPNPASVALHEALGFEPVGVYRNIGFKHGRWLDVGWWQRTLNPADGPPREPLPPPPLT